MLVTFTIGKGPVQQCKEWTLDQIPRKGEFVQLDGFLSGYVRSVSWVLADDSGFVLKSPYVAVLID